MALIDIVKLNDELNAMIAAQEAEIKRMEDGINDRNMYRFMQMVTQMAEFSEVVRELEKFIKVPVDMERRIEITGRGFNIQYLNYMGYVNSELRVRYRSEYNIYFSDRLTSLINWWWDNATEFRRRFEEECVKILREKAEKANAKYKAAADKYSSAMARKVDGCRTPESQVAPTTGGTPV